MGPQGGLPGGDENCAAANEGKDAYPGHVAAIVLFGQLRKSGADLLLAADDFLLRGLALPDEIVNEGVDNGRHCVAEA